LGHECEDLQKAELVSITPFPFSCHCQVCPACCKVRELILFSQDGHDQFMVHADYINFLSVPGRNKVGGPFPDKQRWMSQLPNSFVTLKGKRSVAIA
jgi:hypothetical protein